METQKKYLVQERSFLNLPEFHSIGSIQAATYMEAWSKDKKIEKDSDYDGIYTELNISDCNRIVTLNLDIDDEDSYKNSLYKLKVLIETLKKLEKSLPEAYKIQQGIYKRREEELKKLPKDTEESNE